MKAKLLLFAFVFMTLLTVAHISLNVGWDSLERSVRETFGTQRSTLKVGFLPVT